MNKNDRVIQPIKAHWASHWLDGRSQEKERERPLFSLFIIYF